MIRKIDMSRASMLGMEPDSSFGNPIGKTVDPGRLGVEEVSDAALLVEWRKGTSGSPARRSRLSSIWLVPSTNDQRRIGVA